MRATRYIWEMLRGTIRRWRESRRRPNWTPRGTGRGVRVLVMGARAKMVERAASREGMAPRELDEAIALLAGDTTATADDVLVVIDVHGLEDAVEQFGEASRGEG